ncbi:MAG TPA: hypothetical protein P5328_01170 [Candidatus Paceibacterota bacterium]|nr:hypothetical protein [Candidatus Paceibacterota bacterium]HRZ34597.1 hypothetical protein [Candidatus Paceibacterota bacterium]
MKFLEKIRQKSNSEKQQFAFAVAFIITAALCLIWFIATFYSFDLGSLSEEKNSVITPIKSLFSSFKSIFN